MSAIGSAVDVLGGLTHAATAVGVSPPAVHQWISGLRPVPPERAVAIERATGARVTCEELRPDVTWHRVPDPDWPHPDGRPLIDVAARQTEASDA